MLAPDPVTLVFLDDAPTGTVPEPAIPAGVTVVRVPAPTSPEDPVVSRWPADRLTHPERYEQKARASMSASWAGDRLALWRPRLEATAIRLHRQDAVELTIACVPSYTAVCVAQRLAEVHEVPFALDVRGPWTSTDPGATGEWMAWITARADAVWDASADEIGPSATALLQRLDHGRPTT